MGSTTRLTSTAIRKDAGSGLPWAAAHSPLDSRITRRCAAFPDRERKRPVLAHSSHRFPTISAPFSRLFSKLAQGGTAAATSRPALAARYREIGYPPTPP